MGGRSYRQLAGQLLRTLLMLLLAAVLCWQAGVALGQIARGATLTVLRGAVSVVHADGSAVAPAASGLVLSVGDRVATVGKAAALVTFFDGSEVELGADTTIAIHELEANSSGQTTILIENVLGSTVHRIVTLATGGSSYRIEASGTVTDVRGTTLGHGNDDDGNVTVYLIESSSGVTFPNDRTPIQNGEACTLSAAGDLVCEQVNGKDVWSVLADGVFSGETRGTDNPGAATGSRSSGSKSGNQSDGPDKKASTPTPTLTPTPTSEEERPPCGSGSSTSPQPAGC